MEKEGFKSGLFSGLTPYERIKVVLHFCTLATAIICVSMLIDKKSEDKKDFKVKVDLENYRTINLNHRNH